MVDKEKQPEVIETPDKDIEVQEAAKETPKEEVVVPNKNDILRDMSKEYGVNLFDAEGLAEFKKFQDSQKTEKQKLEEQLQDYSERESKFTEQIETYEARIAGLELGIDTDKLQDALTLAKNHIKDGQTIKEGLAIVKEKYGEVFGKSKGTNTKVSVGTQQVDNSGQDVTVDPALARYLARKNKK